MVELVRLVNLIEKRAKKAIGRYINFSDESLETKLYNLIREGKVNTDKAAIEALYSIEGSAKGYKMLKSRLIKKLFAAVDMVDLDDKIILPSAKAEQECLAILNRVLTLLRVGEIYLAHKFVLQAIEIGKTLNSAVLLARSYELAYKIAGSLRDENLFKKYEAEHSRFREVLDLELDVEVVYQNSRLYMLSSSSTRADIIARLPDTLREIEAKWLLTKSPRIFTCWQYILNYYHETAGNFEEVITNAQNVEKMVEAGQLSELNVDLRYYKFVKLYALLQLRRYKEGLAYAALIEPAFIVGTNNWATFMENYFLLALHSKAYVLAHQLIEKVLASGAFDVLNSLAKERWTLNIRLYNLIASVDKSGVPLVTTNLVEMLRISLGDKEGYNVAIIILEYFNLLQQEGEVEPSSHADRIRKYIKKHLNKQGTERPRLFLKLVLLMLRENLDPAACRTKGRYLYQKLKATPWPSNTFAEVEIIPYEHLWELALQKLVIRKHRLAQNKPRPTGSQ